MLLNPLPLASTAGRLALGGLLALHLVFAPARADQNDPRLDPLFERLQSTNDVAEADAAENAIWRIWLESDNESVDDLVARGISAMSGGRLATAIDLFTRAIELMPTFAEGWNKRATAYYLADDLAASVSDIERTLALEPRHFGAISGMGLIFMRRGDEGGAVKAFEQVLRIHPHARGARSHLEQLRRAQRERRAAAPRAAYRADA